MVFAMVDGSPNTDLSTLGREILRLALTPGLGSVSIRRLLERIDDPARLASLNVADLASIRGISRNKAGTIHQDWATVDIDRELEHLATDSSMWICPMTHELYPSLLRHIHDPPPVLFVRGELSQATDAMSLAMVGSRRCTAYGRDMAGRLAARLCEAGLTIVSGGARGVDTAAHRGCVRVNGRTVVVLGCGHGHTYPAENRELYDSIVESGGVIVTEHPFATRPAREHFPRRNRIISGWSLGTLVVEAPNRSGALITARLACEDHNREVMALPGRADWSASDGCHRMIREGWAHLVTSADDILAILQSDAQPLAFAAIESRPARTPAKSLDVSALPETQQLIYAALEDNHPTDLDLLGSRLPELSANQIQAQLTMMELGGLISRDITAGVRRVR